MKCPGCGRESVADSVFCTYCGAKLLPSVNVESSLLEVDIKALREAVSKRSSTDRIIPAWVAIVPYIVYIVFGFVAVAAVFSAIFNYDLAGGEVPTNEQLFEDLGWFFAASLVVGTFFYGIYAVLAYVLVDRSNRHLERETAVMAAVKNIVDKFPGGSIDRHSPWDVGRIPEDGRAYGAKRVPLVWALAIIIPVFGSAIQYYSLATMGYDEYSSIQFVYVPFTLVHAVLLFYMLHFLTDDAWKHDQTWTDFARGTKVALARAGMTAGGIDEGYPTERRSSGLYVLLSFLTMGIFIVFWWYAAVKDTNAHYAKQALFEDQLINLLSGKG